MSPKKYVTFDEVYSWINIFERERYLSDPVFRLINHMKQSLEEDNYPRVQYYIGIVSRVSETLNATKSEETNKYSYEYAEVQLECACAYYKMGDLNNAVQRFRSSLDLYKGHSHNTAVTYWLLGCAFWRRSNISDAISIWERACDKFISAKDTQSKTSSEEKDQFDWYESRIDDLCETLNKAIDEGRWPFSY